MENTINSTEIVEQPNSCEISVNAKGDIAYKVKAYANSVEDACEQAWCNYELTRDRVAQEKEKAARPVTARAA